MSGQGIAWAAVAAVILLLLLFTVLFNISTNLIVKLFKALELPPMFLVAIFKELSILGLISFILFYLNTWDFLEEDLKELIEEVHMALFASTAVYIAFVFMLLFSSSTTMRRVKYLENKIQKQIINDFTEDDPGICKRFKTRLTSKRILNKKDYASIRRNVIELHNLPEEFVFSRYVRKSLQETLVHITEIDFKVWLSVELLVFICLITNTITGEFGKKEVAILLLIVQYLMVVLSIAMIIKSKLIIKGLATMDKSKIKKKNHQKRSCANQQMKTFCPCTMKDASESSMLFWLKSRGLFRGTIQMMLLIQAIFVALLILTIKFWIESGPVFGPFAIIAFLLAVVWILFFALPYLVPIYALSAYSAEFANVQLLNQCLVSDSNQNRDQYDYVFPTDDDDGGDTEPKHDSKSSLFLPHAVSLREPFLAKNNAL